MCRIIRHERPCSARMAELASVAQGIEHRSPKAGVAGSNPAGGTMEAKRCPAKSSGTAFFVGKRAAVSRPACRVGKRCRHIGSAALLTHASHFSRSTFFLRSSHSLPYLPLISAMLVLPRLQWQSFSACHQYQRCLLRLHRQPHAFNASRFWCVSPDIHSHAPQSSTSTPPS